MVAPCSYNYYMQPVRSLYLSLLICGHPEISMLRPEFCAASSNSVLQMIGKKQNHPFSTALIPK